MALRYIDGFEDLSAWVLNGSPTIIPERNGNGLHCALNASVSYQIPAAYQDATVTFGFAHRVAGFGTMNTNAQITAYDTNALATTQWGLSIGGSGQVAFYRGATQVGISAAGALTSNIWQYIEVQVFVSATVGTVTIRVNGVVVLTLTGVNTKNSVSSAVVAAIQLSYNLNFGPVDYDDFYLMTGSGDSFQGDCRIETLYPNGNGTTNAWLGSDGDSVNNYLLVNETGNPDISNYVASATSGQQDLYQMGDLSNTTQAILAVQPTAYAIKTDTTARLMQFLTRRVATTPSSSIALDNINAFTVMNVLLTDPDTGAAWTPSNVNALQVGVGVV